MANEMKGKPSIDCSSSSTLSWKLQYELKKSPSEVSEDFSKKFENLFSSIADLDSFYQVFFSVNEPAEL